MSGVGSGNNDNTRRGRQIYDDPVRVVATYSKDTYEIHYLSESIENNYTRQEMDKIHEDIVLQDIERSYQEKLFKDMGGIEGKVRMFEDGIVAHFYETDRDTGFFITLDASISPRVRTLYEIAEEYG